MANNDLTSAIMKVHGVQEFMGGGTATHTMPDGTVMPGATHGEYEAMGMRHGGTAHIGAEAGAAISDAEMQMAQGMQPMDPAMELESAIEGLQIQKSQTTDPDEIKVLDRMIESASVGAAAPLGEIAAQIQLQGRGEDTSLAHLRPGEVIIPPEAFEDEQFEGVVNKKFEELGIDPETMVSSVGIASLNPITGLEEFGFLKKLVKGIKKVVKKVIKPIAKVAQFIPGPWQPIAALANKAFTVIDVATGKANPLSLLTVAGPLRVGPSIGDSISAIKGTSASGGGFLSGLGQSVKDLPGAISKGIGSLVSDPLGTAKGLFRSQNPDDYIQATDAQGDLQWVNKITGEGLPTGITDPSQMLSRAGAGIQSLTRGLQGNLFGTQGVMGGVTGSVIPTPFTGAGQTTYQDAAGNTYTQQQMKDAGLVNPVTGQLVQQAAGQFIQGQGGGMFGGGGGGGLLGGVASGLLGGGAGGMLGGLGSLAAAGIPAYLLGKMAYDEAKADKGVPLTPLTTMGPTGRYNIEAEIARRMGTQAPNPVEFGLLPSGTIPTLSGGQPPPLPDESVIPQTWSPAEKAAWAQQQAISAYRNQPTPQTWSPAEKAAWAARNQPMNAAHGGAVYPMAMAYAEGGNVSIDEFNRMNGAITGDGTETSDDIPAMLSDGEFVMTGEAVRGAGGYDLNNQDGILTLIPAGAPDRENGTSLMYDMMGLFSDYVGDSRRMANV